MVHVVTDPIKNASRLKKLSVFRCKNCTENLAEKVKICLFRFRCIFCTENGSRDKQIENLQQLCTIAKLPYSIQQLIDIELSIVKRTGNYMDGLSERFKRPAVDRKNSIAFKTHFVSARNTLKKIWGPTMQSAGYGTAHHIS